MTYSPPDYWIARGRRFEAQEIAKGLDTFETVELTELLATLRFDSVLELGCGFGRVGAAILARRPDIDYTGLDVSPDLAAAARRRLGREVICADLATFDTDQRYDLVLAVSVLGHLLPVDVPWVIGRMRRWARRDIVTVDWSEVGGRTAYQFGHDYERMYGSAVLSRTPVGERRRLAMWHVRPHAA